MSETRDTDEWWTTNHRVIRRWADARDAVPVCEERGGEDALRIEPDPDQVAGEPISWEAFFDRFDAADKALLYRSPEATEGAGPDHRGAVVDRASIDERTDAAEVTQESEVVRTNQLASSDTGEGEPVTFERVEGDDEARSAPDKPGTTTMGNAAKPANERYEALVLDEVREGTGALDPGTDEFVAFENAGERPLDVSGWTVRNEGGRSYEFDDLVLEPGERVTLHSGNGRDAENERYWHAQESVWQREGDTVVVESPAGDRVIEERYKGGR